MKTKTFLSLSLCLGLALASCNDDDKYDIYTEPVLTEDSVVTGSADVTATSATMHATLVGIQTLAPSAYTAGFNYGFSPAALTQAVKGDVQDGVLTATVDGLADATTVYYQAYLSLGGKLVLTGEVKSLITTDAVVTTGAATAADCTGAQLSASVTGAPAGTSYGFVIAARADEEEVRAGLITEAGSEASYSLAVSGLAPATTYYYAGYADLGPGVVYGDVKSFTTPAADIDVNEEFVDLGLSVKWAKHNIGSSAAAPAGGKFGFGDLTGVNTSIDPADYASADIYRTSLDLANRAWNSKATLPTASDFEELFTLCTKQWTEVDGQEGYLLTGPNGNTIFLPAAGSRTISEVSGAGVTGLYGTGTANESDPRYAVAYRFGQNGQSRTSTPVYEALSIRPVSTARNVALDMDLLCQTWEIDYNAGETTVWNGPVHFYGTADCWGTVTNHEPIIGDSWCWDADKSNTWAFGDCTGYMTLNADGTVKVKNQNGEEQTGTYTVDPVNKTITSTVDLLAPDNFKSPMVENRKEAIKILSLSDEGLQLGYFRDSEPATLAVNMVRQAKKYGFPAVMMCVASDWSGPWDANLGLLMPADLEGRHTAAYNGSTADVMVFCLDFQGLAKAYPRAIVTVNEIRCDGTAVKFDPSCFRYGDIEDNGNFRIELFNTFGKASHDNNVKSPFSDVNGPSDPNFNFSSKLEIDYTVTLDPVFTPTLITINPDWGGPWDYNEGATFSVAVNKTTGLYEPSQASFTFNYAPDGTDHSAGSIMTFVEVKNLKNLFPGANATLDMLKLDGADVTGWDPAKVYNTSDGGAWRLELWNMYGTSSSKGCAFGTPGDKGEIRELGFSNSMQLGFTLNSLYTPVTF